MESGCPLTLSPGKALTSWRGRAENLKPRAAKLRGGGIFCFPGKLSHGYFAQRMTPEIGIDFRKGSCAKS
ncbi:hypothetical protein Mesci_3546 [Mesorhizobium ciceri biovar biserrulae WSM1271]|uniref:Uncharacterized protein n=1 Tax=Mesorhizobium ciceri biovar biserrulae (strain HAMBI 2942 / LMG 23838 / WSM1271) TaxID=765698 RepID=E8TKG7_MESCW|nr:hypothetical protein Mesci_3546 [Mesorhizobium ciceri biovar biserrulae WSM1271]